MIELSDDLIFAEGGRRVCYVHPDDPDKCVKVLSARGNPRTRRKKAVWYKKMRPLSCFDDNKGELKDFRDFERRGEGVWEFFPRCYGMQETNRGDGIVTDLIRDEGGIISITVKQYLKAQGQTPELLTALDRFFDLMMNYRIITRDILHHNLVIQRRDNGVRIVMIDGFGSSEMIPFSSWIQSVARKKVARKIARFKTRYGFSSGEVLV